jgi:SprT protein
MAEVLCHEAAHVAAYELYGAKARPHGSEWAALVTAAGFRPRHKAADPNALEPKLSHPPRKLFEHLCPVCQITWVARKRMSRWRCTYCLADGLTGELVITERTTSE